MPAAHQQVRRVLLITLALNLVVAFSKIALGLFSGVLAVTADGFHSLVDASGNVAGLIATTIANRPPDDDHPYGHRRFETIAALFIGAMLLLTAWEVVRGVIERLSGDAHPDVTPLAFVIMIVTLIVNIGVSRYQIREGHRLHSEILLADAQNTRADVFVTLSVIISMGLVAAGWIWADVVAALLVVGLIGRAAWQILQQTGRVLVDTAPLDADRIEKIVANVPNVRRVIRVRSRGTADAAHIDVDVQVAPEMTADHTAQIARTIRTRLTDRVSGIAEIEVHFAPHYTGPRDYSLIVRACADALGLATHEVRMLADERGDVLELHVEVLPNQTLAEAHAHVSQLEHDILLQLPHLDDIITHIEPAVPAGITPDDSVLKRQADMIGAQALHLLRGYNPEVNWHNLVVRPVNGGFLLATHAVLPPQTPIETAHRIAEDAETRLRSDIPRLSRVTIHTEPFDH